ncbi:hypothetical protein RB595_006966 [Gaeumannomyces hyphopodioides]
MSAATNTSSHSPVWNEKLKMSSIYRSDWDSYYRGLTLPFWGKMSDDGFPETQIFDELIQQYKDDGGDMGKCSSCRQEYPTTMMSLGFVCDLPWWLCFKQTCTEKFRRAYADAPQLDEAFERGDTVMLDAHPDELFGERKKPDSPPPQNRTISLTAMQEHAAVIRGREARFKDPRDVQDMCQKGWQKSLQD